MRFSSVLLVGSMACLVSANPAIRHTSNAKRSACSGNTATTRTEWCDYDINTDYTSEVPDTGVTREYYLELIEATVAPDGYSRTALTVNGSIPGPTLEADWGDTVVVHVTNSLTESKNGTSIHFHGIRQNYTNQNDGVVAITQCPTAPGDSITYTWRATQYGSTWYHSHFDLQAWEGVFGGIIINGPASSNYDEDKGILILNDWSHQTVDELYPTAQSSGPPTLDNALINGTNVYGDDGDSDQTGYRFNTSFTAGTSYRFRLVNAAIDTHFKFSIDNHTLTVIAADLVPIEPYNTTVLDIAIGQRYDVIVTADQSDVADNFWMRAIPQEACSDNDSTDNIKGIVYYGDSPSTPTTTGYSYTDSCDDEDLSNLVPVVSKDVSTGTWQDLEDVTVGTNSESLFRWYLNETTFQVEWNDPTLLKLYNNITNFTTSSGVIKLPDANEWAYIVIQTTLAVPHPIHLHGHDFFILAQGTGTYNSSDLGSLTNPPRRDTAMLPSSGYLVLAFKTDNPGAWLMHCHIGWHTEEGFALQFIERYSEISGLIDYDTLDTTCAAWKSYESENDVEQDDSTESGV
ncbi:Cupredoxin [Paecilomyces variotii]|uniref:laccase n=1 Tax=Byssochlamys spectabilis TaxID=264951 RepID=A0A443I112_BYSSP|nr:Cupredoxin [Paecilomyces variotii]KAJ9246660.1 CAZyme family AA1 [Paecilomyces variotii]KAJ9353988.1 CAZyme family AA1 [Paecilomyces variotii]KAJ9365289.1 CAZyme family AA1 [Paecilomyces variotii]RWQ97754.1 Cupredoxin [Paecilomyces variotii]